ncbi:MAG TPA: mevalonate kinase [Levilinea sp.]|nr:mevalonate kinase [Levilinea sp.]
MPATSASASGKIILFGEHAVVYDRPAIAVPVTQVRAKVVVMPDPRLPPGDVLLDAPDIGLRASYRDLPDIHPLRLLVETIQQHLGGIRFPAMQVRITSTIPVAAGLGSSAAVSTAMARSIASYVGRTLTPEEVSQIAYTIEKAYHGTPSGIDNTVIAYAKPVFYQRNRPIEFLLPAAPFTLVIADSGLQSSTAVVVRDVRQAWQRDPSRFEDLFDAIAGIVTAARRAIEQGPVQALGALMVENHRHLQTMGVSCPQLDHLVDVAMQAGALGAKPSGAGRGGNVIALVAPEAAPHVAAALQTAGANRTITTVILTPTRENR